MLGHMKTLKIPSCKCTAKNSDHHKAAYICMNQDTNFGKEKSSHASLAFSPEMKPLNSIELYTKISP
jgi:hypothetical protein